MRDYDAFISYSHRADQFRADALQRALQNLGRPFYRRKNLNVFRDETSLSSNPALWASIERALQRSRTFVLMASPESAASPWCTREVEWWLSNRSTDTFLIVLTGGDLAFDGAAGDVDWTLTTALSPRLTGRFPVEPFYRDLRWAERGDNLSLSNTRFRAEVLPLAAALHGIEPQELDGDDLRQFRRNRLFWRSAAAALAVFAIVSAFAAWVALAKSREATRERDVATNARKDAERQRDAAQRAQKAESLAVIEQTKARAAEREQRVLAEEAKIEATRQRDEAIRQRNVAVARQLAVKAEFLQNQKAGLLDQSLLLAAESLRRTPSFEADQTMRRGLALLPKRIAEARYPPYLTYQGLTAVSDNRLAFITPPQGEIHIVAAGLDGFQELGRWVAPSRVFYLAFDRISYKLVIASKGGVFLWDVGKGEPRKVLDCGASVAAMHGNRVAADCDGLKIIDVATGSVVEGGDESRGITGMAFDPSGTRLAASHEDGTLTMWQLEPWKLLYRTADKYDGRSMSATTLVAFDSFGDVVVRAGPLDKTLHVYAAADGHVISSLPHPQMVLAVDITGRGNLVATAGEDGTARVFDGTTGSLIAELRHQAPVRDVRFTRRDERLYAVTASEDNTARLWDIDQARELARATAASPIGVAMVYSGHRIATLSYDGALRLWDMAAAEQDTKVTSSSMKAVWSRTQETFVMAHDHGYAGTIDPAGKRFTPLVGEGHFEIKAGALSADGRIALWGGPKRTQVWDVPGKRRLADVNHQYAGAWALSADGSTFAVQDFDAVHVYRLGQEQPLLTAKKDPGSLYSALAVSATHVAYQDFPKILIRRLLAPASPPVTIPKAYPERLAFSPDGRTLAWDGHSPGAFDVQRERTIALEGVDQVHVEVMAFAPDGHRIAFAGQKSWGIWSLDDGRRLVSAALEATGSSVAFALNGEMLAVGSEDGTAGVWRTRDGAQLTRVALPPTSAGRPAITATALSPDGSYLLTSASSTRVWVIDTARLIAQACSRLPGGLSPAEWRDFVGSETYRNTCAQ